MFVLLTFLGLNLSNNTLGAEGTTAVSEFLAAPNQLRQLGLANVGANLESALIVAIGLLGQRKAGSSL